MDLICVSDKKFTQADYVRRERLASFFAAILLTACGPLGSTYAAEVGYYEGDQVKWEIWGNYASLDECRGSAIAKFNYYNQASPGRATSWACLKRNRSGGYESRHR